MRCVGIVFTLFVLYVCQGEANTRNKRYLFVNPDAPITLGFLLNVPISLALPTLADKFGRALHQQQLHHQQQHHSRHVFLLDNNTLIHDDDINDNNNNIHHNNDDDNDDKNERPENLFWDPAYEPQLDRLSAYFGHLELPTLPCQERLICELTSEPKTYAPIGNIFIKELRLTHGPVDTTADSLMWRYMSAAREGFGVPVEDCGWAFPSCPLPANRILNMAVLKVWQYISSKLNLQLV
ncbi:hypothetical protein Pmani_032604 [Petrolisthes manimaculis]|uniref:Uncharacterized protein n=1 Tax=Petrolisthes manimaculis TaxID=1843537 RepID=A0AAE1TRI8_9EUCA|nr:hypothetical protein Pmani_032604 [Petrolisthes manimaculis]